MATINFPKPSFFPSPIMEVKGTISEEIELAFRDGTFVQKLQAYCNAPLGTAAALIRAYLNYSVEHPQTLSRADLDLILAALLKTDERIRAPEALSKLSEEWESLPYSDAMRETLHEIQIHLLSLTLSYPNLSHQEWDTLFSLANSLNSLDSHLSPLLTRLKNPDRSNVLAQWVYKGNFDESYFNVLEALYDKFRYWTIHTLYEETDLESKHEMMEEEDDETLPFFDDMIRNGEPLPLLGFLHKIEKEISPDSFRSLIERDGAEFQALALKLLKSNYDDEMPDEPYLGVSELTQALLFGDLTLAKNLVDCGVPLEFAGEHPQSGLELLLDWYHEQTKPSLSLTTLCDICFSGDNLAHLFEDDYKGIKIFFHIFQDQSQHLTMMKREHKARTLLPTVQKLIEKSEEEPRLKEVVETLICCLAKFQRYSRNIYFEDMKLLSDLPLSTLLLPLVALQEEHGHIGLNQEREKLYMLNEIFPNHENFEVGFSPEAFIAFQKRDPQSFSEFLDCETSSEQNVLDALCAISSEKAEIESATHFIIFSNFVHLEKTDPDSHEVATFLSELEEKQVGPLFSRCLAEGRFDLMDTIATHRAQEDEDHLLYSQMWRRSLSDYFSKTPLTPLAIEEILNFLLKHVKSELPHSIENGMNIITRLFIAISLQRSNHEQLELALIPYIERLLSAFDLEMQLCPGSSGLRFVKEGLSLTQFANSVELIQETRNAQAELQSAPAENVILQFGTFLQKAGEPQLLDYLTPYFNRHLYLPYDYVSCLENNIAVHASEAFKKIWSESPLGQFHHALKSADHLSEALPYLHPFDFISVGNASNILRYLSRLEPRKIEAFVSAHLNAIVEKAQSSERVIDLAIDLGLQGVAAQAIDRFRNTLSDSYYTELQESRNCRPLSQLISLKEITRKTIIKEMIKNDPELCHIDVDLFAFALKDINLNAITASNFQKVAQPRYLKSGFGCGMQSETPLDVWNSVFEATFPNIKRSDDREKLGQMLTWLENAEDKPLKSIPLKKLYDYVAQRIDRRTFEQGLNIFDLGGFINLLYQELDRIKTELDS